MSGSQLQSFDHLLTLADQVLSSDAQARDGKLEDLIAQYCEAFDSWFDASRTALNTISDQELITKLLLLQSRHHSLVDRVQQLMQQTSFEMSKLKVKGKAILTYTDFLPKRLSTIYPRKG